MDMVSTGRFNPWRSAPGAVVPNWLMERTEVSPGAKLCWARLAQHASKDGVCKPRQEVLAAELGVSERQARRYVEELEQARLIEVEQPGLRQANRYHFLRHPWMAATVSGQDRTDMSGPERNDMTAPERTDVSGPSKGRESEEENQQNRPLPPPSPPSPSPVDEPGPEDIRSLTGRGVYAHPLQQHARRKVATGLLNTYCAGLGHKPRGARSTKPFIDALMRLLEQGFPLDVLRAALDECGESPWELEATAHAVRGRQQRTQQAPDTSWWPTNQPDIDLATHRPDPEMAPRIAALLKRGPRDDAS